MSLPSSSTVSRMKSTTWPSFSRGSSVIMKGSYSSQVTSCLPIQKGEIVASMTSSACSPCQRKLPPFTGSISKDAPVSSSSVYALPCEPSAGVALPCEPSAGVALCASFSTCLRMRSRISLVRRICSSSTSSPRSITRGSGCAAGLETVGASRAPGAAALRAALAARSFTLIFLNETKFP